jgi:hypothetical protein
VHWPRERHEIDDRERILPAAIIERFTLTADGEFEPLVEGSSKPIAQTRRHAGIVRTRRFTFDLQ